MQATNGFDPSRYLLGLDLTATIAALLEDETLELRVCRIEGAIYVDGNEVGVSMIANSRGVIEVTQLLSEGFKGASKCILPFPFDLDFSSSQGAVRKRLGPPAETRLSTDVPPWDAFFVDDYRFHFSFDESGERILMLTIARRTTG